MNSIRLFQNLHLVISADSAIRKDELQSLKDSLEECLIDFYEYEGIDVKENGFNCDDIVEVANALKTIFKDYCAQWMYKVESYKVKGRDLVFQIDSIIQPE